MALPTLPNYLRPPVVEVILGVQFETIPELQNAHLGAFWATLGEEWPRASDAPVLKPQYEGFGKDAEWGRLGLEVRLATTPAARLQITNRQADRMIQVQNGRLHFNWLGQSGGEYPRYEAIREGFVTAYRSFQSFLAKAGLGELRPNQWEVTYLNHIPSGTVWSSPQDWGFFRLLSHAQTCDAGVDLESFSGEWHYEIVPKKGRLHIAWQHGRKTEPSVEELVVLTLTARGPVDGEGVVELELASGLDTGRNAIVRAFRALMSDDANHYWGLTNADA